MIPAPQTEPDVPNFSGWDIPALVSFAQVAYVKMQEQEDALALARLHLKDAMKLLRKYNTEDDWR